MTGSCPPADRGHDRNGVAAIFEIGVYTAANECQFHAAPVEWSRSAAAPAGSNQEKLGGDAMTEKTVRPHSVLRRPMLVGTAGGGGWGALPSTPARAQTAAPPPAAPARSRPPAAPYGPPWGWAARTKGKPGR